MARAAATARRWGAGPLRQRGRCGRGYYRRRYLGELRIGAKRLIAPADGATTPFPLRLLAAAGAAFRCAGFAWRGRWRWPCIRLGAANLGRPSACPMSGAHGAQGEARSTKQCGQHKLRLTPAALGARPGLPFGRRCNAGTAPTPPHHTTSAGAATSSPAQLPCMRRPATPRALPARPLAGGGRHARDGASAALSTC
jgi:hypothetical protein